MDGSHVLANACCLQDKSTRKVHSCALVMMLDQKDDQASRLRALLGHRQSMQALLAAMPHLRSSVLQWWLCKIYASISTT